MEPVGVAIGALGLVGLFSTCIDGFQLVERGKYLGKDFDLLETKFCNQRLRLKAWGEACGLMDTKNGGYDSRLDEAELRANIERTLNHIMITLQNERLLANKYGLKEYQAIPKRTYLTHQAVGPISRMHLDPTTWREKFNGFKHRIDTTQKQAPLRAKARWAIGDRKKFVELVQDLKDLIDDLEGLTAFAEFSDIVKRQREIIGQKVATVTDVEALASMEEARMGPLDAVSDAATFRLSQLYQQPLLEERLVSEGAALEVGEERIPSPDLQGWSMVPSQSQENEPRHETTKHHILHRVKCHENNSVRLFFDHPTADTDIIDHSEWTFLKDPPPLQKNLEKKRHHLRSKRLLPNLEAYLEQNFTLSFLIFHDYECCIESYQDASIPRVKHSVRLLSQDLCEALNSLPLDHLEPSLRPESSLDNELHSPFLWLYHSGKTLQGLEEGFGLVSHHTLGHLLDCIGDCMAGEYAEVDFLLGEGCISMQYIGYIYCPGTILLEHDKTTQQNYDCSLALKQISPLKVSFNGRGLYTLEMDVEGILYDGGFLCGTWHYAFKLAFKDRHKIVDMPLHPLQYAGESAYTALCDRGRRFLDCQSLKYISYGSGASSAESSMHDTRFIIDARSLSEMNIISIHPKSQQVFNLRRTEPWEWKDLRDFLILLPSSYKGFNLCTQTAKNLYPSQIKPVEWIRDPLDDLDIESDLKELLVSMLTNAMGPFGSRVLLHGPSGTGKNYFIDRLAETAQRPLYRVNLVDIVNDPTGFSGSLERLNGFQRAWGCVIHLRAGDVFEERIANTNAKNSLISSLFNFFEKFDGILFVSADSDTFLNSAFNRLMDLKIPSGQVAFTHRKKVWADELEAAEIDTTTPTLGPMGNVRLSGPSSYECRHDFNIGLLSKLSLTDRQIRKAVEHTQKVALSIRRQRPNMSLLVDILRMSSYELMV